ncbi:hypothetical protein EJB05_22434 [Eragrostis curvula]|uniref:Uncharacterized protein n=1 Tax=Eragrostis curvula TaxID=38414 RepID=A0A5J9V4A9_9POAL|nr:hypothetical protein EJB05_22434 [Eragrostis curvula]
MAIRPVPCVGRRVIPPASFRRSSELLKGTVCTPRHQSRPVERHRLHAQTPVTAWSPCVSGGYSPWPTACARQRAAMKIMARHGLRLTLAWACSGGNCHGPHPGMYGAAEDGWAASGGLCPTSPRPTAHSPGNEPTSGWRRARRESCPRWLQMACKYRKRPRRSKRCEEVEATTRLL